MPAASITAGRTPGRRAAILLRSNPTIGAIAALVLLVVVNSVLTPNFATTSNLWNILWQVSSVVLVSVGMTFVIATGGIDLSVGSVMAIAGALSAVQLGHGAIAAVLIALGGALAIGGLNGALVSRDLGGRAPQAIVITLATLIAGRGLAQVLSNDGQLVSVSDPTFELLGRGHVGPVPVPVLIAALAGIVATLVLRTTSFGRYVLAVGGNRAAARLAGVPVRLTLLSVYIISALLSAVAGLLEVSRAGASDAAKLGLTIELDAIAAVVIGGTVLSGGRATILGTIVGALVMQVIATSFNMLLVPYAWSLVLKAVIIVVAVYAQRGRRV